MVLKSNENEKGAKFENVLTSREKERDIRSSKENILRRRAINNTFTFDFRRNSKIHKDMDRN